VELPDSGEYEILITYSADFNKGLTGMYIAGRESREMITTDFEPDGASFAFPCFDRPDQKAIFPSQPESMMVVKP
jgi:Aminopeptidase N